jgi:hypothetical protein
MPLDYKGIKGMSYGWVSKEAGPGAGGQGAAVVRGPMVSNLVQQLVLGTAWGELDFLVLDLPPGTGDIQLTLTQALAISASVVVTTPHRLSYVDVVKGMEMFEKLNIPTIAIVENMVSRLLSSQMNRLLTWPMVSLLNSPPLALTNHSLTTLNSPLALLTTRAILIAMGALVIIRSAEVTLTSLRAWHPCTGEAKQKRLQMAVLKRSRPSTFQSLKSVQMHLRMASHSSLPSQNLTQHRFVTCLPLPPWCRMPRYTSRFMLYEPFHAIQAI